MRNIFLKYIFLIIIITCVENVFAHVQLDYPGGGENFKAGDTVNIQWHVLIPHTQENWDLYFSSDAGITWETIELDMDISQLNYLWTVPQITTEKARIRIHMDNTGQDYDDSSGDFTIQGTTNFLDIKKNNKPNFMLYANYPNPFNPETNIGFSLPEAADVSLKIYNSNGREIRTLISGNMPAGFHSIAWDGTNALGSEVAAGLYFYQIKSVNFMQTRKMVLMK